MLGISIYAGLDLSLEDNLEYLTKAAELGINKLFFSLHIPEVKETFTKEAAILLEEAKKFNFEITADISRKYYKKLEIKDFKIDALRLDFGFNNREIAALSKEENFKINLNASTLRKKDLQEIESYHGNLNNIEVSHNYYPRPETGLSEVFMREKNKMLKEYGFKIGAFIPANYKKRSPLKAGLPSLEVHRDLTPLVSCQHLFKLGIDKVYIGDSRASEQELKKLTYLKKGKTILPIQIYSDISSTERELLKIEHTNREDPADNIIRSQEARTYSQGKKIPVRLSDERFKYAVTIDNYQYQRYQGELQILKKKFPADSRVNLVADAGEAALLIENIQAGDKFKFYIKGDY
ncbi:DUF871 family protein [Iocasia frigidifontis]|uniref:DUF871 family protein n=1 Tax=Iocasia fonsfrigidae TaxID=2682810 RepID=A0A8A7KFU5_9FIRM|nr:MupG family TIM beta-alpha barrel fold protein [Iocasia fonsfrigidae]QTL96742.1 DUF871 family protein [Iocasia fonsfrigidae]